MARRPPNLSWQLKLPILLVLFASVPLAIMGAWMFGLLAGTFERSTTEALEALASAKAQAIEQFTSDRSEEVERIAQLIAPDVAQVERAEQASAHAGVPEEELPELQDAEALPTPAERAGADAPPDAGATGAPEGAVAEPPKGVAQAVNALRRELRLILWDQQKFEELLVIAADGQVLVSTFTEHEGTTAAELDYFRNGLGATFVQPVFMSPLTGRLTTVMATPIRNGEAQVIAVLAARLNLTRFFRLINDATGLGDSGETVVGQTSEGRVRFMAPTRHDPEAALTREVPLGNERALALQRAARGEAGGGRIVDYRGKCAYAAWEHVATLDWGLVVKLDCAEALAPVHDARNRVILVGALVALLGLGLALVVARSLVRPLGQLKAATERISKGDFNVMLDIAPGDEIGELAESFERMIAAIKFFRERARPADEDPDEEAYDDETDGETGPAGTDEPGR